MSRLIQLIKWEYLIQNRINNLTQYLVIFFSFCTFSLTLINEQENITKFSMTFSIILLPLALMNLPHIIFKQDLEDGNLELLLTNFTANEIIISKFLTICLTSISSTVLNLPIIYFFFNISLATLTYILLVLILLLILASALLILIAAIQSYFRANTYLLPVLIMPLLMPNIILGGIIIHNPNNLSLTFCMLGINIILLPIILFLAAYLISNIYNI
ncbi:heme exporter protein CcmB [Candidatus Tisiphia endosymbiont of Nemotelus uliginosus]|uniref:heme exporter protein CcmB n=1 Tax=Candidatus Tisiphia endosymbiont of Nemotelus uliginosus TaxID=3077926 RepID=UPI0035C8F704